MKKKQSQKNSKVLLQDGVPYPVNSPWPKRTSWMTQAAFPATLFLAIYILSHTSMVRLIIYLVLMVIIAWPTRYFLCARCPYCGENCCTIMGKYTPFLFKKQEGKSMKIGLWLDLIFFILLIFFPIYDAWEVGGFFLTAAWFFTSMLNLLLLNGMSCPVCPFTFCPIGKISRALWTLLDLNEQTSTRK